MSYLSEFPNVPQANLAFDGLANHQLEFVLALYVGAFNRAGEYAGVKYWAGELSRYLQEDRTEGDAYAALASALFHSGANNGESGTGLPNREFVEHLYRTVLGREPDSGGWDYWTQELDEGKLAPDTFLVTFLYSALQSEGDKDYIGLRVEVAKFAAQERVSGPAIKHPLDLASVMEGVDSPIGAFLAIQYLDVMTTHLGQELLGGIPDISGIADALHGQADSIFDRLPNPVVDLDDMLNNLFEQFSFSPYGLIEDDAGFSYAGISTSHSVSLIAENDQAHATQFGFEA